MVQSCIVCQSTKCKDVLQVPDYLVSKEVYDIVTCVECQFRYIQNPPPENLAYKYYETEEYIEHSDSSEGMINSMYHAARDLMLRYKHRLISKVSKGKRILDFGTGTGYFLNYMKSKGYDTTGIEISEKARQFGQKNFGLNIHSPDAIYQDDFATGYDIVTFWHVLEHIYQPEEVLRRVHSLMSDDGRLVIALPNHKSVDAKFYGRHWAAYDVPRHLWHFDKDSLDRFAQKCGFELQHTKMLPLDPYYNSLISESYRGNQLAYLAIPFVSGYSMLLGMINKNKASSIIYILKKA